MSGTDSKEALMVLSNYKVGAGLAVSDMDRAREFYEGKLGLLVSIDSAENVNASTVASMGQKAQLPSGYFWGELPRTP